MSPAELRYAGIATRGVAFLGDMVVAGAISLVGGAAVALVGTLVNVAFNTVTQVFAVVGWAMVVATYFVFFWTLTGQTPGMRLMRLQVATADGGAIGFARSVVRVVGLGLAFIPLGLGFLPILLDDRRRGLHDFLAGTVVVSVEPTLAVSG